MKALLMSLVAVALVGGLAGGGLFAYFSDTETSTGNTFTAGTIDITLEGDIGEAVHASIPQDFKPCETGYLIFTITNVGENPADLWKLIYGVVDDGGILSEPEEVAEAGCPVDDISSVVLFDLWIENDTNPDDHDFNPDQGDVMLIPESEGLTVGDVADHYIYLGVLDPTESMTIVQSFHLAGDAGNEYQGDTFTFNEDFYAQQVVGGVAPPQPELPGHGK